MKSISEIRNDIRRIAQANVQLPLMDILDHLENMGACECQKQHEEALDSLEEDSMLAHGPSEDMLAKEDELLFEAEKKVRPMPEDELEKLELETLEVENDYVQQNIEETE